MLKRLLAFSIFIYSLSLQAQDSASSGGADSITVTEVNGFANLRHQVLNLIGSAKNRIWIVTDYLTDGEIVSALFIAQYRKLDVKVLLGKKKANSYMSRLSYLEKQNIPVFLKPVNFPSSFASQILIDNNLFKISGDLNFLDKNRNFRVQSGTRVEFESYYVSFEDAVGQGHKPIVEPIPMVGRAKHSPSGVPLNPRANDSGSSGGSVSRRPIANYPAYQGEPSGAYNYDKGPRATTLPEGMNKRLPAQTIYQKRQASQEKNTSERISNNEAADAP